jgi:hypothetical protein
VFCAKPAMLIPMARKLATRRNSVNGMSISSPRESTEHQSGPSRIGIMARIGRRQHSVVRSLRDGSIVSTGPDREQSAASVVPRGNRPPGWRSISREAKESVSLYNGRTMAHNNLDELMHYSLPTWEGELSKDGQPQPWVIVRSRLPWPR